MGQVSISIRGRQYQIACDDGQEAHLARLGRYLDQRAEQVAKSAGSVNDALLLVLVSLMITDELADMSAQMDSLNATGAAAAEQRTQREETEKEAVEAINGLAARIERIAVTLADT